MNETFHQKRNPRFETAQLTYAYLGEGINSVGRVRNISNGGICIDYVRWRDGEPHSLDSGKSGHLDLVVKGAAAELRDVPFEVVYEQPMTGEYRYWAEKYEVVTCGIKFVGMNETQRSSLQSMLASPLVYMPKAA